MNLDLFSSNYSKTETYHLVDTFEVTPPALLSTTFALGVPALLEHPFHSVHDEKRKKMLPKRKCRQGSWPVIVVDDKVFLAGWQYVRGVSHMRDVRCAKYTL